MVWKVYAKSWALTQKKNYNCSEGSIVYGKSYRSIRDARPSNPKTIQFSNADIIAMDETSVWNDMVSNTTVEKTGSKEVPMKSTGYDKVLFVWLRKRMESD